MQQQAGVGEPKKMRVEPARKTIYLLPDEILMVRLTGCGIAGRQGSRHALGAPAQKWQRPSQHRSKRPLGQANSDHLSAGAGYPEAPSNREILRVASRSSFDMPAMRSSEKRCTGPTTARADFTACS